MATVINGHLDHKPLTFGKYKGQTPSEIAEHDPSYVKWMHDTFDRPVCSETLYRDCLKDIAAHEEDEEETELDTWARMHSNGQ